ncbi:MAG TPA: 23S rRNA (uridine(2552)-2'-O)-methyltransferase RlmE [Steroidobacteraceae bacterium]|nr:23S rRNA (uridine(2552)-2'-O)-methyltransferase RlmE [Steroidobacteraceae bacterium]
MKRSKSSSRWLQEHAKDPYVKRAHREGWRSRAAFKLEQIQRVEKLIRPGMLIVDLGAAPGGWSQFAARALQGRGEIYALDVLEMPHIPGVTFIEGDFQEQAVLDRLLEALGERKVDLVMSDMAPNMSGIDAVDQPRSMNLAELALDFAGQVLKPGGDLLMKVFQGAGFQELVQVARRQFTTVKLRKPDASRARSAEMYLLARSLRMV